MRRSGDALDRVRLAAAANEIVAPLGYAVRAWAGRFIVASPTGRAEIVTRFDAIFGVARRRRAARG